MVTTPLMDAPSTASPGAQPVEWRISEAPVDYEEAVAVMEARAAAIAAGEAGELVWLLEHPALYTAGTSAAEDELLRADLPIHRTGRGGRWTYHGPGQRVAYVMLDLRRHGQDVRRFVRQLEGWLVRTLDAFNVKGELRDDRVGVWVSRPAKGPKAEDKIAALGVRVRRWVSFHGVALNVEPDLAHFAGIVPCGIAGHGVTSLADLGRVVTLAEVDQALRRAFEEEFGVATVTPSDER